jgi:hypothetical protein
MTNRAPQKPPLHRIACYLMVLGPKGHSLVAAGAHYSNDLLGCRRVSRISLSLVARLPTLVEAGQPGGDRSHPLVRSAPDFCLGDEAQPRAVRF